MEWKLFAGVLEGMICPKCDSSSVTLVVLYYLPKIISNFTQSCDEQQDSGMKSYSDDVLEEMK